MIVIIVLSGEEVQTILSEHIANRFNTSISDMSLETTILSEVDVIDSNLQSNLDTISVKFERSVNSNQREVYHTHSKD